MSTPVSIVIPSLFDPEQFERSLPPLLAYLGQRAAGDQVLVVDDTGEAQLEPWLSEHFPTVEVLSRKANGGFAAALTDGVRASQHGLVFCMNPDVVVHGGFLEPLLSALEDPVVHSVVPRMLLMGDAERIESVSAVRIEYGLCSIEQPGLAGRAEGFTQGECAMPYAIGGAMLMRRDEFLDAGGFDPLFEPFYWEDVDLGWSAWRAGRRVLYVPESVVEHHHRGTIKTRIQENLVRAMIEKNRLLFQWKHLDEPQLVEEHLQALNRWAIDAWIGDEREELIWLALALEQAEEARERRTSLPPAKRSFSEIQAQSEPRES